MNNEFAHSTSLLKQNGNPHSMIHRALCTNPDCSNRDCPDQFFFKQNTLKLAQVLTVTIAQKRFVPQCKVPLTCSIFITVHSCHAKFFQHTAATFCCIECHFLTMFSCALSRSLTTDHCNWKEIAISVN